MLLAWLLPHFQLLPPLPYATGTLLVAALVLSSRVGGFAYILGLCGPFKWTLLRDWKFLPPPQPPLVLISEVNEALFFWHQNPGLHNLAWGWNGLLPRCSSSCLSTTCECGAACSARCCHYCFTAASTLHPLHPGTPPPPLIPIWMNMSSFNLWLSDFHTVRFSDSSSFILF